MSAHRIRIVIRRHLYVMWRAPHRWFDIAFWPLMDVILWGSLGVYVAQQDATSKASAPFLIGGAMMFHVLFQSQIAVATGFMEETWSRNLMNVLTTPVTEFEYITGTAILGIAKVIAALTVVSITAYAFFSFDTTAVGWALVPISLILMIVGWGLGIAGIGAVLRFGQGAEIITWGSNFILMALSGAFNPVESLPAVLQPISAILPSTKAFDAMRQVLAGQPLPVGEIVRGLIGSVVFVIAGFTFSWYMLRSFRRRGFITRFS
jgi:ABC-2 type transport system permease protein